LIDGCIFYLNPLQRSASDELWDLLRERDEMADAMRTVAGGSVLRLRENGLDAVQEVLLRPADVQAEVEALQRRRAEEHDRHAEPGPCRGRSGFGRLAPAHPVGE